MPVKNGGWKMVPLLAAELARVRYVKNIEARQQPGAAVLQEMLAGFFGPGAVGG